ncbi:MAG: hypothetical protein KAU28_01035, partial [Phycisphaerae bacterium]|nr:hypothetical protein [Phycisphaerae bacterium]
SKTMFRTLASRAAKEDSPPILAAIFQMLYLLPDAGRLVSQEALTDAQNQAFEILHANWGRCCRLLLTGGAGMAEALEKGIGSLQGMASLVAAKSDGKKAVLQMIVDAMYCSFLAYDAHCAKADRSDVAVRTNASLLLTCEKALSEISEIRKTTVEDALTNPRVPDRPAAVGLAVLDWVEALKDLGVIKPDFKMPAEKAETGNQAPK